MKNIKIFVVASCMALGLTACDLDRNPKNSIPQDMSLLTFEDARLWSNGHMASLRSAQYGGFYSLADKQADFLHPKADYGNNQGDLYRFEINAGDYDTRDVWSAYYSRLININEFISKYPKLEASREMSRFAANAYFIRAYYYSELIKRFAPAYDAAKANTELGVPMVTEYDVKARPARATQAEIYKLILSDIAAAKAEYTKSGMALGRPGSIELTPDALAAFEMRVHLQMNNFEKAFEVADALIKAGRYPLGKPEDFAAMWREDRSTEDIMRFYVNKDEPSEAPFSVGGYYGATVQQGVRVLEPTWLPAKGIVDKFDAKDVRRAVYLEQVPAGTYLKIAGRYFRSGGPETAVGNITLVSKYRGNLALAAISNDAAWGGPRPDSRMAPKFIRIAEVYLGAAEAAYKLGKTAEAQKYLNDLRQSRGLDAVNVSGEGLFTEIQAEYEREFFAEGRRLWDLKRWGLGFKRYAPQPVLGGNNLITVQARELEVPAGHYCFTWPIPNDDMRANPNLKGQQNKGY